MAKENNGKVTGYFQNGETQNSTKTISYLCGDSVEVIEKKGRNVIPEAEKEPLWKAYLEKFKDPIIIILLVALMVSTTVTLIHGRISIGSMLLPTAAQCSITLMIPISLR